MRSLWSVYIEKWRIDMKGKYLPYIYMNQFRLFVVWLMIQRAKNKHDIFADIDRYIKLDKLDCSTYIGYCLLMLRKPEFCSQVAWRLKQDSRLKSTISKLLFKGQCSLYINTKDIGPGLYIQHGFSTIISAKQIGKKFFCNQQVTIGYEGDLSPIIGNDVRVCAGAKCIGGVYIADGCIIGANAVVVKDTEPNSTLGVPAVLLRYH